jgi:hypothetical protein
VLYQTVCSSESTYLDPQQSRISKECNVLPARDNNVRPRTTDLSKLTLIREKSKKMVKKSLCLTNYALCREDVWGSGCIDPCFLDLEIS